MNAVARVRCARCRGRRGTAARYVPRTGLIAGLGILLGTVLLIQMASAPASRAVTLRVCLLGALAGAGIAWAVRAASARWRHAEGALLEMSPAAFEQHVAALFARAGFEAQRVGASGDGGVDIRVRRGGRGGIVQCKRYRADRTIGPATIRELVGARAHERADMAWLATTGRITEGAQQLAAQEGVALLDAAVLAAWEARLHSRRLI
jgi:Restriction endonuclease